MACGCEGSTAPTQQQIQQAQSQRRDGGVIQGGGPGQPGYTWDGPQTPPAPAPPAE